MLLSLHICFSFVRAAMACVIPERAPGFECSSETIAPRYLKLVTVSVFCPLTLISLWMSLIWRFCAYHHLQLVQVLMTRALSSCSPLVRASMSSANRRSLIVLPPFHHVLQSIRHNPSQITITNLSDLLPTETLEFVAYNNDIS